MYNYQPRVYNRSNLYEKMWEYFLTRTRCAWGLVVMNIKFCKKKKKKRKREDQKIFAASAIILVITRLNHCRQSYCEGMLSARPNALANARNLGRTSGYPTFNPDKLLSHSSRFCPPVQLPGYARYFPFSVKIDNVNTSAMFETWKSIWLPRNMKSKDSGASTPNHARGSSVWTTRFLIYTYARSNVKNIYILNNLKVKLR